MKKNKKETKTLEKALRHPPGKYLIGCYFLSRWRCCILTGSEACASPAGGRGPLGASY